MNVNRVIGELKKLYSDKDIIINNKAGDNEIICEIKSTYDFPEESVALAVIGKSAPHYHKKSIEIYEVVKGKMTLFIEDKSFLMKKGDRKKILPNKIHWVKTDGQCWFLTYSKPGWTSKDHIVVGK